MYFYLYKAQGKVKMRVPQSTHLSGFATIERLNPVRDLYKIVSIRLGFGKIVISESCREKDILDLCIAEWDRQNIIYKKRFST